MNLKYFILIAAICMLPACTTGKLYYKDNSGNRILGCDVEFVGLPSVDKFAVEYALSLCAKSVIKKGHSLEKEKEYLLVIDTTIPSAPCGKSWDHELAKNEYKKGSLSKKEYGYIVANIDLGLAVINECSSNKSIHPSADASAD